MLRIDMPQLIDKVDRLRSFLIEHHPERVSLEIPHGVSSVEDM